MPSFINHKNKLQYIERKKIEDELRRLRQEVKNKLQKNYIRHFQRSEHAFKKIRSLNDNGWENMNRVTSGGIEYITKQYKNWSIELPKFDYRLLPFIERNILFRNSDGSLDDEIIIDPYISHLVEMNDIEGETYLKQIFLKSSIYFEDSDINSIYQAKLVVTFANPRDYS